MPTIEELKKLKAQAKIKQAEEKKLAKKKPPKPRKEKHYADGGEEQWESAIAPPRMVKGQMGRDGRPLLETYKLESGEWSFSPKQDGPISLYGASANRLYGWDGKTVNLKGDAYRVEVWYYTSAGVRSGLATDKEAVAVRQRYMEIMNGEPSLPALPSRLAAQRESESGDFSEEG